MDESSTCYLLQFAIIAVDPFTISNIILQQWDDFFYINILIN